MNNVCLTGQVVVLFRRLVHVVSTVSVAQQYHFYKRNRSTAEHTSSQPAIEYQDLPLGETFLNGDRYTTISRVLAEQWSRLRGTSFWESWRSSLMPGLRLQEQPSFSAHLSYVQTLILLIPTQSGLYSCRGLGQRGHTQPTLVPSHPIKSPMLAPTQLRNPSNRARNPTPLHLDGRKNLGMMLSRS